jgi:dimethylargininase
MTQFTDAIARTPAATFADGLASDPSAAPSLSLALEQHARYVEALQRCGLRVTVLEAEPAFPDSTFVEDTAVIVGRRALLTRPGAASRLGEAAAIRASLVPLFNEFGEIAAPGTLDGGDVCETDERVYIGLSERTNREGAEQLAAFLAKTGVGSSFVDIRDLRSILHLKSGMSYLGDGVFVVIDELLPRLDLNGARVVRSAPGEEYGANCVRVNDAVLVPTGHPDLEKQLRAHGLTPLPLDVSEYRKMDGGLSCLSLRFNRSEGSETLSS